MTKIALACGNFPYQLMLINMKRKPFPVVDFAKSIASVGGLFNQKQKIYIKPTEHFVTKFRQIFTNKNHIQVRTRVKGVPGRAKYEILATAVELCAMLRNHMLWHFARHFEWNAVESAAKTLFPVSFLFHSKNSFRDGQHPKREHFPGDPTFNHTNNRICAEFGVEPTADFRFTYATNHILGIVFICFQILPHIHKHGLSQLAHQVS